MPLSLPALLDLDQRLQRATARLEPHTLAKGRGRVEGAIVRDIAYPRYLVWRSFLQRMPTRASVAHAIQRLRGYAFYALALAAQAKGLPLPVKPGTDVPAWALRRIERAQQPDVTRADENDPADYWDTVGWDSGLYPEDVLSAEQQAAYDTWLAETMKALDFELWLQDVALPDMTVLQALDAAYNTNAATQAGQETIAEAGLAGDFSLQDPAMLSYLQFQAGAWITNIDDTTRSFIGRTLFDGLGGDMAGIIALSPEQLANEVRNVWGQLGNDLEQMSRYRARMITVTELARAETFGQMLSIMGLGIKNKEWLVTEGACIICLGNASMGPIPLMQPFPSGDLAPPGHPLCFVPGTLVAGPTVLAGSVRPYTGEVVTLHLVSGATLTGTPNHPVRSLLGWTPMGSIVPGDTLEARRMLVPRRIEDAVMDTASEPFSLAVEASSYHGDGMPQTLADIYPQTVRRAGSTAFAPDEVVVRVTRSAYDGLVYTLETETGWFVANGLVVKNCRCSLAPAPDANDPYDGTYTYDPEAVNALIDNPSMANWPAADGGANSIDLSAFGSPATPAQLDWRSPQAALLGYDSLPESLQALLDPTATNVNIGSLRLDAFGQALASLVDERVIQPRLNPGEHTPQDTALASDLITLDSLLGEMDDTALDDASQAVVDTIEQNLSSLDDVLRRLRGEE